MKRTPQINKTWLMAGVAAVVVLGGAGLYAMTRSPAEGPAAEGEAGHSEAEGEHAEGGENGAATCRSGPANAPGREHGDDRSRHRSAPVFALPGPLPCEPEGAAVVVGLEQCRAKHGQKERAVDL